MEPSKSDAPVLTGLLVTQRTPLTTRIVEQARAQVPWCRGLVPAALERMIAQDYRQLIQVLQSNDAGALRVYVEQVGQERLQWGAPAESLIALVAIMEENLRRVIDTELVTDPVVARDATRRVQSITRNIRMILSGLNLRRLTSK